jgi:predicted ATPase
LIGPEDRSSVQVFLFGPFRLLPARRLLLEGSKPVRLGSRAMDILTILVAQPGQFVNRDELIARVWPDTSVDEAALRVHISALRKTLGDGHSGLRFIANAPRRGYSFVAPVASEHAEPNATLPAAAQSLHGNDIAASLTSVIGRDTVIATLSEQLLQRRLLTVLGPGGIGKTTVAAAVAEHVRGAFADGAWFLELASLQIPDLVIPTIGTILGIPQSDTNPLAALITWLRDRQALLVFDNCEQVIDEVAKLAETIIQSAPRVCILATSREPMRAKGEMRHRLAPLACPSPSDNVVPTDMLQYPAVQLFVERAAAAKGDVIPENDLPHIVEICRRLDGVPLALELVAAHVGVLSVQEIAARLDDRLALQNRGRRTAAPRHRTLRATLDWSHDLLPPPEQIILRRLAVFQGHCTMQSINAVVADQDLAPMQVANGVANLVDESLVAVDIGGDFARYHLLETTRVYALEKLQRSGEHTQLHIRHARHFHQLVMRAESAPLPQAGGEGPIDPSLLAANLRSALDWAFSPEGDSAIGIELTTALTSFWVRISAMSECRRYVERALAALRSQPQPDARTEMILNAALGASLIYTTGPVPETLAGWSRTLQLAEMLGDVDYQLRALRGLWSHRMNAGDYRIALSLANDFCDLARRQADTQTLRAGDRMAALILHYLGEQSEARRRIEWSASDDAIARQSLPPARFMLDQSVAAQALLSRILWLQGFSDQARRMAEHAVRRSQSAGHAISQCHALAQAACPVSLWTGDLIAADSHVTMLIDLASQNALEGWIARGKCFRGVLLIRRGEFAEGVAGLQSALGELRTGGSTAEYPAFQATLAHGLAQLGKAQDAQTIVEDAMRWSESTGELWCVAELLRVKAEILQSVGAPPESVEDCFRSSLDIASQQGALSYALRAATDLARFLSEQNRFAEARGLLAPIIDSFTEGFGTTDMKAARQLLGNLA